MDALLVVLKKFFISLLLPLVGFLAPASEAVAPAPVPDGAPQAAVGVAVGVPLAAPAPVPPQPASVANAPGAVNGLAITAIKTCLAGTTGEVGRCLDSIFREYFKAHPTSDATAAMRHFEATDLSLRLSCHPVMHAIGRETFRVAKTIPASFSACDQTCHSGCYHGAMERFLRGDAASGDESGHISAEELKARAATACDSNQPTRFRFQCLHGLGHALLFFMDYQLEEALSACDALADAWSRSSCYGGLFMENVFSATPERRDLSPSDYHYPCSKLDPKYKSDCYMMQTTRMSEMGLPIESLFTECRATGGYQHTCMQSIGRDLSNDARVSDPRVVAEKCELGHGPERQACTRGVAYALLDNTWDGRYAFPFCASFRGEADMSYCFTISVNYLRSTFERAPADILADCQRYAAKAVLCGELVGS